MVQCHIMLLVCIAGCCLNDSFKWLQKLRQPWILWHFQTLRSKKWKAEKMSVLFVSLFLTINKTVRALNRLRTGVGRAKTVMRRWGYLDDAQSVDCDSGEPQTMAHLLSCRLLDEACTADDLATVTERAKACARKREKIVWRTRRKKKNTTVNNDS